MAPDIPSFVRWDTPHLFVVGLTLLATCIIALLGKCCREETRLRIGKGIAVTLALMFVTEFSWRFLGYNGKAWQENLPLHFCSVMVIVSIIALGWRKRWACAMVYFGVLTASVQGLITPALEDGYPTFSFCIFFISHGMLFLSAMAVIFLLRWKARRKDILRTLLLFDAYILAIIPVNLWLGTNYCFTQKSPVPGCILDYLGAAPWYYLWLQPAILGIFTLMYLPLRERYVKS